MVLFRATHEENITSLACFICIYLFLYYVTYTYVSMYIGHIFFILAIFSGNNIAKLGMLHNFQLGHIKKYLIIIIYFHKIEVDGHYSHVCFMLIYHKIGHCMRV